MDARDKVSEMRQTNYEAALDRIGEVVDRALTGAQQAENEGDTLEALVSLQVGTLELLMSIAMSLASIQWMGVSDFDA